VFERTLRSINLPALLRRAERNIVIMSISNIDTVRKFMTAFENFGIYAAMPYLADGLLFTNTAIPGYFGKREFLMTLSLLMEAMPDFKWNVEAIFADDDHAEVAVTMYWTGTHTGVFRLSKLWDSGIDIAPTGIYVCVPDSITFTLEGDRIAEIHIVSDEEEGLTEWLRQVGFTMSMGDAAAW
jgi:predicted ester cyclase